MVTTQQAPDSIPATSATTVALIVPNESLRESITRMLAGLKVSVVRECTVYPEAQQLEELLALDCDVLVVDLDTNTEQALGLIENICGRETAATVVATSASSDPALLIRSMRSGAREFLPGPIQTNVIAEALARTLARREKSQQHAIGKVLVFAGSKGGSGVTTVATNFAVALTKENAGKVVAVDMDMQLGEVALGLGLAPQFSVLDALKNEARVDKDFLMTLLVRHTSGLAVLGSPEQYTSFSPPASSLKNLIGILRREFGFVVVDAGTSAGSCEEALLDLADTVYLVTEMSIPALRNARRLISFIAGRQRNPRLEVVLNRFNARETEIDEDSTTKALGRPVDWRVPNDFLSVRTAENTGVPVAMKDSAISRVMHKMAINAAGRTVHAAKKSKTLLGLFQ